MKVEKITSVAALKRLPIGTVLRITKAKKAVIIGKTIILTKTNTVEHKFIDDDGKSFYMRFADRKMKSITNGFESWYGGELVARYEFVKGELQCVR